MSNLYFKWHAEHGLADYITDVNLVGQRAAQIDNLTNLDKTKS